MVRVNLFRMMGVTDDWSFCQASVSLLWLPGKSNLEAGPEIRSTLEQRVE
jgi:hypothetical protein